jgi:hypothetical protein
MRMIRSTLFVCFGHGLFALAIGSVLLLTKSVSCNVYALLPLRVSAQYCKSSARTAVTLHFVIAWMPSTCPIILFFKLIDLKVLKVPFQVYNLVF